MQRGRTKAIGELWRGRPMLLRSGLESLMLRVAGLGSTFLLGVVLARSLGPADYGVYGLIISVGALLASICALGTPQLTVQEFAVRASRGWWRDGVARLASFQVAALAAWAVICGVALLRWMLLRDMGGDLVGLWLIGALIALCITEATVSASALRGMGALNKGQIIETVVRPVAMLLLAGALLLLAGRITVRAILLAQLAVAAVGALLCQWWVMRRIAGMDRTQDFPERPDGGHWLRQALPLGLVDAIRQFDGTYALLIMGWTASRVELGQFRVALACVMVPNLAISVFHVVLAPRVSQLFDAGKSEELQLLLLGVSRSLIALSLAIVAALLVAGRWAIVFAFGPAYAGAWLPLVLLTAGQAAFGFFGMGPILLAMSCRGRPLTLIYLISAAFGVTSALLLIGPFGAVGAGIAQGVSLTIVGGLSDLYARRRLGLRTSILPFNRPAARPRNA